jgi:hypothetical protein
VKSRWGRARADRDGAPSRGQPTLDRAEEWKGMRQGWRAAVWRLRTVLLAAAASGGAAAGHAPGEAQAAVSPAEQAAWDRARSSGSTAAFQRYLELYPTGQYAEDAFRTLVEKSWRPPARPVPRAGAAGSVPDPLEPSAAQAIVAAQSLY